MAQTPGWYLQPDGQSLYWNGAQWLAPTNGTPSEPTYVKRKNRVVPGVFLLLGALLSAASAFLPWISVAFADVSLGRSELTVGVQPTISLDGSISNQRDLLLAGAAAAFLPAVLMLWTKRRGWGPLLRLLYAVPWSVSLGFCLYWWWLATSKLSDNVQPDDVVGQVVGTLDEIARSLGIYRVDPAVGLYLWSIGIVLGLVGLVVPGRLYEVKVPRR